MLRRVFGVLCLLAWGVLLLRPLPAAAQRPQQVNPQQEIATIRQMLDDALAAYRQGDRKAAFRLARDAYLDHFEQVEIPLRVIDSDFTLEMEYRFADLRSKIRQGAPLTDVEGVVRELYKTLDETEALFEGPGVVAPGLATTASFSIIFREGLEIILLLGVILGYLEASRNQALRRYVWWGAGLALPATVITWLLIAFVIRAAPLSRELLEAAVSLVAVAVLFYVSFWILQRLEHRRWMEFIRARVWAAMSAGNPTALVLLGFTAVYREGVETVLFYQALLFAAKRLEVWVLAGFVLGVVALLAIGVAMLYVGVRVPTRVLLSAAALIIMFLSIAFLGNGVRALQEAGVLPVTSLVGVFPRLNRFVAELTGLHPTLETLSAQLALLLVYLAGAFYVFWLLPRREQIGSRHPAVSHEGS